LLLKEKEITRRGFFFGILTKENHEKVKAFVKI